MSNGRFPVHVSAAGVRATAGEVLVLAVASLALGSPWPALLVALDFGIRVFAGPRWSPLAALARSVLVPLLGLPDRKIPFTPKRFAAAVGLVLSGGALVLGLLGLAPGFYGALGVLALFSALESFAGFCAGCTVYDGLMRWGVVPEHSCPECRLP